MICSIRQQTGAGVDLIADTVKLTGTQEAVLAAQKIVEKVIADEDAGPCRDEFSSSQVVKFL